MDEARADEILRLLEHEGYVEERAGEMQPSRKWNAKLQAAAEKLNILAAKDLAPDGNPLVLAVSQALANENLGLDEAAFDDAVRILVTLELTRMGPTKRAQAGFADVQMDGPKDDSGGVDFSAAPR